jgi:uncharacterized protein YmfQ (DUF2313 family)
VLAGELMAEGHALDEVQASAAQILREGQPLTASALLAEWELEYGLSNVLPDGTPLSVEQRRAAIQAKLTLRGGQSRGYFIALVGKLGFPAATINEFNPATCVGTCNDALYSESDKAVWRMNLPALGGQFSATCNSNCNSALASWGSGVVEAMIKQFKPADTAVVFAYV